MRVLILSSAVLIFTMLGVIFLDVVTVSANLSQFRLIWERGVDTSEQQGRADLQQGAALHHSLVWSLLTIGNIFIDTSLIYMTSVYIAKYPNF